MKNISSHQAGLAFGGFLGLVHLVWSLLVAIGLAQPIIDFIFNLHMIQPPYKVMAFSITTAVGLVVVTSLIGYVIGYVLSTIWNKVQKSS